MIITKLRYIRNQVSGDHRAEISGLLTPQAIQYFNSLREQAVISHLGIFNRLFFWLQIHKTDPDTLRHQSRERKLAIPFAACEVAKHVKRYCKPQGKGAKRPFWSANTIYTYLKHLEGLGFFTIIRSSGRIGLKSNPIALAEIDLASLLAAQEYLELLAKHKFGYCPYQAGVDLDGDAKYFASHNYMYSVQSFEHFWNTEYCRLGEIGLEMLPEPDLSPFAQEPGEPIPKAISRTFAEWLQERGIKAAWSLTEEGIRVIARFGQGAYQQVITWVDKPSPPDYAATFSSA